MTPANASPESAAPGSPPALTTRFLVIYSTPTAPETFERHYREVHAPLAKQLPGLRRYSLSRDVTTVRGDAAYYLVVQLEWDSADALRAAFNSPHGRAAADDMVYLAALPSVPSVIYDTNQVP